MRDATAAAVFAAVLFAGVLGLLLAPQKFVSVVENRELAAAPSLSVESVVSGRFAAESEIYLLDRFPLRDMWAGLGSAAAAASGQRDNGRVDFGDDGWLFSMDAIDLRQLDVNLGYIREFIADASREYPGVVFSVLPAPASWTVAGDMLPPLAPVDDETGAMFAIQETLGGDALVCDPTEALSEAFGSGVPVYYRTDHHWTSRGAYTAYRVWAKSRGLTPLDESDFNVSTVSETFFGTNASKAGLPWTAPDIIEVFARKDAPPLTMTTESEKAGEAVRVSHSLYDVKFLAERDQYAYFLGGNNPVVTVDTGAPGGGTLLLVKDSFAHCFAPFLTAHFSRIILVDPRYHRNGFTRFFEENDVTDVLFLYSATQIASDRNLFYLQL
ncbi:MAG: hypothetical protein LBK57_10595 [Clostridiales Family XIII bacterium]|jgi:hypothetical protein|nr:hypothetical protein [Clostridiales Family XIII bacterium]